MSVVVPKTPLDPNQDPRPRSPEPALVLPQSPTTPLKDQDSNKEIIELLAKEAAAAKEIDRQRKAAALSLVAASEAPGDRSQC